jgi:hypothetical protein
MASHVHLPVVVSQTLLGHAAHATPPVPQADADCDEYATQVLPLQQPLGHDLASQTQAPVVVLHSWPDGHALHANPPVPHVVVVSDP